MRNASMQKTVSPWPRRIVVFALACLVAGAVWLLCEDMHRKVLEQEASSVRQTVLDRAMQCAAIEGAYPSSLAYLEDNYGLVVDHDDYIVDYTAFASNVPPSVVVIAR